MNRRLGLLAAIALVAAACSGGTTPVSGRASTSDAPSVASVAAATTPSPSVTATAVAAASRTLRPVITPRPIATVPPGVDPAGLTLVCTSPIPNSMGDFATTFCPEMILAVLSALEERSVEVTRMNAGTPCGTSCAYDVLVGFFDGHLEGFRLTMSQYLYEGYIVGEPQPIDASEWPWGATAYRSPRALSPELDVTPPPDIAPKTVLPYCGKSSEATTGHYPADCFRRSVLAGLPAEYVDDAFGLGTSSFLIYRSTGRGELIRIEALQDRANGPMKWSTSAGMFCQSGNGYSGFGYGDFDVCPRIFDQPS